MTNQPISKYCGECGNGLSATTAFCTKCGSAVPGVAPVAPAPAAPAAFQQPYVAGAKSKTPAVLLAVFLGYWTWLYTFKLNRTKFFIGLGVGVLSVIVQISTYVAANRTSGLYTACIDDFLYGSVTLDQCVAYQPNYSGVYLAGVIGFGIWLWALIDTARRPASYFANFPNER